ncbi:MAG: aminotransferase class IV [Syntrophobacteraceae bacterium]
MPGTIRTLSFNEVIDRLMLIKEDYQKHYLAMYSSWYGGVVVDPALMMVPIDDHMVHRGDGIFEVVKCRDGKLYALERHIDRLERSSDVTGLPLPFDRQRLVEVICQTIQAAGVKNCLIRLFISRGPGGFSTNPYECPESQLYIVVTNLPKLPEEKYTKGVSARTSLIPIKKSYLANVKSCNYLPNVLMKKEAVEAGVDYTISVDENGFLGEGSTENIAIITKKGEFVTPHFDRVLHGVTVNRMMELAESLLDKGDLKRIGEDDITPEAAYEAAEVMMFGTSFDVLPVVSFDSRQIGDGRPGHYFKKFLTLIREDIKICKSMLTPVWDE